ncbi:MAG: hypothetical protein ABFD90_11450 [Phycisphaerales bacterium]
MAGRNQTRKATTKKQPVRRRRVSSSEHIEVRADLLDVENTVRHLVSLSEYFKQTQKELSEAWHGGSKPTLSEHSFFNGADKNVGTLVRLYEQADSTAAALYAALPSINNMREYPRVSDYVQAIRSHQGWIEEDRELIDTCNEIVHRRPLRGINYWAVKLIIRLHEEQLRTLAELENDLKAIEKSERVRIEAGQSSIDDVPVVDLEASEIHYKGNALHVTESSGEVFKFLMEHPRQWKKSHAIRTALQLYAGARIDRFIEGLPPGLHSLIESRKGQGGGYRYTGPVSAAQEQK